MNDEDKQMISNSMEEIRVICEKIEEKFVNQTEVDVDDELYYLSTQIASIKFLLHHWDKVNVDRLFGHEKIISEDGTLVHTSYNGKLYLKIEMVKGMSEFPLKKEDLDIVTTLTNEELILFYKPKNNNEIEKIEIERPSETNKNFLDEDSSVEIANERLAQRLKKIKTEKAIAGDNDVIV